MKSVVHQIQPELTNSKMASFKKHMKKYWQYYALMLVPIVYYIIFRYIPMAGNIIAFRRYRAGRSIFGDEWSGLKYFRQFIGDKTFWRAFRNTLVLNISYLLVRFPLTLIFALLLNEIKNLRWKKFVQTVSYLPHFISMVIVTGMIRELLSTSGPINALIKSIGGEAVSFIALPEWFTPIFVISGVWQNLGWGTILYLAAIAGINPSLYEAAEVDGANKWQRTIHIVVPSLVPLIVILTILKIGGIFHADFGLFYNVTQDGANGNLYSTTNVIDTWTFRAFKEGTGDSYGQSSAMGLMQSIIGIILVLSTDALSKKIDKDLGLF